MACLEICSATTVWDFSGLRSVFEAVAVADGDSVGISDVSIVRDCSSPSLLDESMNGLLCTSLGFFFFLYVCFCSILVVLPVISPFFNLPRIGRSIQPVHCAWTATMKREILCRSGSPRAFFESRDNLLEQIGFSSPLANFGYFPSMATRPFFLLLLLRTAITEWCGDSGKNLCERVFRGIRLQTVRLKIGWTLRDRLKGWKSLRNDLLSLIYKGLRHSAMNVKV